MKTKTFFILITSLILSKISFSQSWLSYGPEIGINMSGMSRTTHLDYGWGNDITKNEATRKPLYSPVVGFYAKADVGKRFFASLGIRYYWVGTNYHSHAETHYPSPYGFIQIEDVSVNEKFHKIAIPISFGYNFHFKKINFFTFLGYSQIYYLSGKAFFKEQDVFNTTNNIYTVPTYNNIEEHEANPFDKSQYEITAKRWRPAVNFGIGAAITKKISLSINCSPNWQINYYNTIADYEEISLYGGSFKEVDFSLTIKYSLK